MFVTLYSYNPSLHTLRTIYRDSTNPTFVDFQDTFDGVGGSTPKPPVGVTVSVICNPGTFDQYSYKVSASAPYATYEVLHNVPACGYVRPTCDLTEKSFNKTNETDIGANDGTANLFCTSSFNPIVYYCDSIDGTFSQANSTGFFTGLPPNDYRLEALDANSCRLFEFFTIEAFSDLLTHFKYRLTFPSANNEIQWEVRLIDRKNSYLKTEYPKDITGQDNPVEFIKGDQNEAKETTIIPTQLNVNLSYTGLDFTVEEFTLAPEQAWKVELYNGADLEFQGYLIPDETQDEYADAPYDITLTATDGLPSLKGNLWGDGSGGQGYGTFQIQQYGLTKWCLLIKQCLDQIGYDYGQLMIFSSLRYNNTYSSALWLNLGTWSDILYDNSAIPTDTYSALDLLLSGVRLCIIQHKGRFILLNWNDLYYLNNGVVIDEFYRGFYLFSEDFTTIQAVGNEVSPQPTIQPIGADYDNQPCNPPQNINYDKAYNIEEDVSFATLALLFENPSFEIGAVQGEIPVGMVQVGSFNFAYSNFDPIDPSNPDVGAADGSWELRTSWPYSAAGPPLEIENYVAFAQPIFVDQANKLLNVSFSFRPKHVAVPDRNTIIQYSIVYTDSVTHTRYCWDDFHQNWRTYTDSPGINQIYIIEANVNTNGDYISWQSYSKTFPAFPDFQIGDLQMFIMFPSVFQETVLDFPPDGTIVTCDLDLLYLTLSDASPAAVNQTGEKHFMNVVTGVPQANLKQIDQKLFTYAANKRVAGNVFTTSNYDTGIVANLWNFALHGGDPLDRLPATVTKSLARNYAYPMHIWEGDVETPYLSYFALFTLKYYDGILFMPFSITGNLRENVWHVIMIEINDADVQDVYTYRPTYERSARINGT